MTKRVVGMTNRDTEMMKSDSGMTKFRHPHEDGEANSHPIIPRPLTAHEMLQVWERGQGQHPVERALTMLSVACPEMTREALASLSIGQRDACLLALREAVFGPQLVSMAHCPQCHERLEQTFAVEDIREPVVTTSSLPLAVETAECVVQFRLPNSQDLAAIAQCVDAGEARRRLVRRCVVEVTRAGQPYSIDQLPESSVEAMAQRMSQADPQSDIQLALSCPLCAHEWQESFDIVSFFWSELTAWATRMVNQVYRLASVYGWREADILAMSPWRREAYLSVVGT